MTKQTQVFVELTFEIQNLNKIIVHVMPLVTRGMTAVRMQWRLAVLIVS